MSPRRYFGWYVAVLYFMLDSWWHDPEFNAIENIVDAAEYADRWIGYD